MASALTSCVTYYDAAWTFYIKGQLVDQESGAALSGVNAFFVDIGFDVTGPIERRFRLIGQSNERGGLSQEFGYGWGGTETLFSPTPTRTFVIKLVHPAYQPFDLHFRAADLPTTRNEVEVNLGEVKLIRRKQVQPTQ